MGRNSYIGRHFAIGATVVIIATLFFGGVIACIGYISDLFGWFTALLWGISQMVVAILGWIIGYHIFQKGYDRLTDVD